MFKDRPRIKLEMTEWDRLMDIIVLVVVVLHIVYVARSFSALPEIIPTHFDAHGQPDGHGSRAFIWVLPGVTAFLFVVLQLLSRYPHIYNYLVKITQENAEKQYRNAIKMIRLLNIVVQVLFFYISYISITASKGLSVANSAYIIPMIIISLFVFIAYYLIKSVKNK